ncbi:hypothetical protein [Spirochaeta cellobiosiphila]|uniref:hypothetical protein n=1 Tax=Spirochaeta cellobiosiphila TaxID=504483 RepID=UPI0003FD0A2B|nr:hypothetical protein [Spirochaeta cellobiosiphila]
MSTNKKRVQAEVQKAQEKILKVYTRRMQGKEKRALTAFLQKGGRIGSSEFQTLSSTSKDALVELNLKSIEIMKRHTKNPFQKIRFSVAGFMTKKLRSSL